jgi:hypothetical protein
VHESRAELHEQGMADDALPDAGDSRFERDRQLAGEPPAAEQTSSTTGVDRMRDER